MLHGLANGTGASKRLPGPFLTCLLEQIMLCLCAKQVSHNCLAHWVGPEPEKLLLKMKPDGKGGCTADVCDCSQTEDGVRLQHA